MTFASSHELAVSGTTSNKKKIMRSRECLAALMTDEQSTALIGGSGDCTTFVVIEIPAAAKRTIACGGETVEDAENVTSAIIVRGLVSIDNNAVNVKIGGDTELTMSIDEMAVPVGVIKNV